MADTDSIGAMKKALDQLKLNQRNLCKGMSISIQKLQARENEESIGELTRALEQATQALLGSGAVGAEPQKPLTLGERMAQSIAQEKSDTIESARRAAQAQSAENLAKFNEVQDFFTRAKKHFETAILDMVPTKRICIQVGGPVSQSTPGAIQDRQMYGILEGYLYSGDEMNSIAKNARFHSLWVEFQKWAQDNGLKALWRYCHDGGGMESWWELRVQPMPEYLQSVQDDHAAFVLRNK